MSFAQTSSTRVHYPHQTTFTPLVISKEKSSTGLEAAIDGVKEGTRAASDTTFGARSGLPEETTKSV